MRTIRYQKLVRDRIPEIIRGSGKECVTRTLGEAEYAAALDAKLGEELAEYLENPCLEELADLLEVLRAAALARGYTPEQLECARAEKEKKRGGFGKRIFLEEVREP